MFVHHFATCDTPVGVLGMVGGPAGLRSLGWRMQPGAASPAPDPTLARVHAQLEEYFAGDRHGFDLPIAWPELSPNTRAVLTALQEIPYGETITYGQLAARSGTGLPARAVGAVMAANPVPIVIPCHRVVASDGLGGYSGGERGRELPTKLWLLEHEGALPPALV